MDKVILVGDWNFSWTLDRIKKKADPTRYRARTRELIKSKTRVHSVIDLYRDFFLQKQEYTYLHKTGANQQNRIDN